MAVKKSRKVKKKRLQELLEEVTVKANHLIPRVNAKKTKRMATSDSPQSINVTTKMLKKLSSSNT
jgi:hypothetical protein